MNILLCNQDWFRAEFEALGHKVRTCGCSVTNAFDVSLEQPLIHLDHILEHWLKDFEPDLILVLDNSAPIVIEGLEETHVPTIFYSVDTHHHWEMHRYLAHVFDHTFVAQKDYMKPFFDVGADAEWMPLYASRHVEASDDKHHAAVFVGNLDAKLNPDRVEFFEALGEKTDLLCKMGEWWKIFPHSEIVINQTVSKDLNFRVFEAMISGALLLTERSENGIFELFQDGTHLVTYEKGDVDEAAEKISYYLQHVEKARQIAAAGRAEVLSRHTPAHRAKRILEVAARLQKRHSSIKHLCWMANFNILAAKLQKIDTALSKKALIGALRSGERGMRHGEPIDSDLAMHLVHACVCYDREIGTGGGARLLSELRKAYPAETIIQVAHVRCLINSGQMEAATAICEQVWPGKDPNEVFRGADQVIQSLVTAQLEAAAEAAGGSVTTP